MIPHKPSLAAWTKSGSGRRGSAGRTSPSCSSPTIWTATAFPDDHEISLFGNLATLASGADDPDGDGLTNRQEFEGGTDPNDYYNGNTPVITLLSGSGQTIHNGQRTDDPLVFLVTDGTGPLANAPVELSHLELIGGLETTDGNTLATTLTLRTDSEGKVAVHFKAD